MNLDDKQSLFKHGFLPPAEELVEAKDRTNIAWGPKCSVGVKGTKVDIPIGFKYVTYLVETTESN